MFWFSCIFLLFLGLRWKKTPHLSAVCWHKHPSNPSRCNPDRRTAEPIINQCLYALGQSCVSLAELGGTLRKRRGRLGGHWCALSPEDTTTLIRLFLPFPADWSHGVPLARPADDLLHHVMGAGGGRGAVFSAQRTQPGVGGRAAR